MCGKLFAKILTAGAIAVPFALPAAVHAQPKPAAQPEKPAKREMTPKELHQHLARGSGWVRTSRGQRSSTTAPPGFSTREKRLMITNNHVVEGHDEVMVTFPIWKDGKLVTSEAGYQRRPAGRGRS